MSLDCGCPRMSTFRDMLRTSDLPRIPSDRHPRMSQGHRTSWDILVILCRFLRQFTVRALLARRIREPTNGSPRSRTVLFLVTWVMTQPGAVNNWMPMGCLWTARMLELRQAKAEVKYTSAAELVVHHQAHELPRRLHVRAVSLLLGCSRTTAKHVWSPARTERTRPPRGCTIPKGNCRI